MGTDGKKQNEFDAAMRVAALKGMEVSVPEGDNEHDAFFDGPGNLKVDVQVVKAVGTTADRRAEVQAIQEQRARKARGETSIVTLAGEASAFAAPGQPFPFRSPDDVRSIIVGAILLKMAKNYAGSDEVILVVDSRVGPVFPEISTELHSDLVELDPPFREIWVVPRDISELAPVQVWPDLGDAPAVPAFTDTARVDTPWD